MTQFVGADHTGDMINCFSHTGIIIYLFRYLIIWYSNKHNTVESNTFGSEIVDMQTVMDLTKFLDYKLRMMGVPINGPMSVFCDRKLVVTNKSVTTST